MEPRYLKPRCREIFQNIAFEHDEDLDLVLEGENLDISLPIIYRAVCNERLIDFLFCICRHNIQKESLWTIVRYFWNAEHEEGPMFQNTEASKIRSLLQLAEFPPLDMGTKITVWRGAVGQTLDEVRHGLSWTLDRDVACWFATKYKNRTNGDPIVVESEILSKNVIFHDLVGDLLENEVVLSSPPDAVVATGSVAEWTECGERYLQRRNAHWVS